MSEERTFAKTAMRPELTNLPVRMADLPIDERGYPVPWFVDWIDGKPEFRAMDQRKWARAIKEKLCWVCGKRLGASLWFVIGPMCLINRTTGEPPCHRECAQWSAKSCPFLTRPHAKRREMEAAKPIGGIAIPRNPGVTLLVATADYKVWQPEAGEFLIEIGEPVSWEWWSEGRAATRAEVEESVRTGLPILEDVARRQVGAMEHLQKMVARFEKYLPEK